jgi:hypothetical protein
MYCAKMFDQLHNLGTILFPSFSIGFSKMFVDKPQWKLPALLAKFSYET